MSNNINDQYRDAGVDLMVVDDETAQDLLMLEEQCGVSDQAIAIYCDVEKMKLHKNRIPDCYEFIHDLIQELIDNKVWNNE